MFLNDGIEPRMTKMDKLSKKIMSYELSSRSQNFSLASLLEENQEQSQPVHEKKHDTSHTLALFRKFLHEKAQQARGLANADESESASSKFQTRHCTSLLPPPKNAGLYNQPTLLEKELLPGARRTSTLGVNSSLPKGQLTIFYSGAVNVYENVPIDKAQAIMLLAGESSSMDPISPSTATSMDLPKCANFPSATNMQIELPIARKASLKRFLDKRRNRMATSSPYSIRNLKQYAE